MAITIAAGRSQTWRRLGRAIGSLGLALGSSAPTLAAEGLPAVTVAVQAVIPTGDGRARVAECSGALIAPDVVLTAGHCLDGVRGPAQVAVFAYDGAAPRAPHLVVARFSRHPGHVVFWRERAGDPATRQSEIAADLALLKLAAPVAGAVPAALSSAPEIAAADASALAGTGRDGPGAAARSGRLKTAGVSAVRFSTGAGARVAFGTASRAVCGGDSGGPLARAGADGRAEIWGVVAAILKPKGGCGTRVAAAPVDPASDGFRRMRAALD